MKKNILFAVSATGILVIVPYLVFTNLAQGSKRAEEINEMFGMIESQAISSVHIQILNNSDSLQLDSLIVDRTFCNALREMLLNLRNESGPSSRLISERTIYVDIVTTSNALVNLEVYVTDITALVFVKTKSRDRFAELDDLYSSTAVKNLLNLETSIASNAK